MKKHAESYRGYHNGLRLEVMVWEWVVRHMPLTLGTLIVEEENQLLEVVM